MKPVGSGAYTYIHKQIVIRLVYFCLMMINVVPTAKGISDRFSPREITTGRCLNLDHFKAPFGEYLETSIDADVTNDIKGQTHPCVSLSPSRNWQGLQLYFDLETGAVVSRRTIKRLPMPDWIIKVITHWGNRRKMQPSRTDWSSGTV